LGGKLKKDHRDMERGAHYNNNKHMVVKNKQTGRHLSGKLPREKGMGQVWGDKQKLDLNCIMN